MTHMATAPGADVHLARVPHKAPSYITRHGPWVFGLRFQTLAAAVTAKGTSRMQPRRRNHYRLPT